MESGGTDNTLKVVWIEEKKKRQTNGGKEEGEKHGERGRESVKYKPRCILRSPPTIILPKLILPLLSTSNSLKAS